MRLFFTVKKHHWLCLFLFLLLHDVSSGQTFTFKTSEASEILSGDNLVLHGWPGTPDTITVWCNDWTNMITHPTTWGNSYKLKSNNTFVKFYVNHEDTLVSYGEAVEYVYRLTYQLYAFNNPADTSAVSGIYNDTLTIGFNNINDNTPFQDINLKKYSNFNKCVIVITGIYKDDAGTLSVASLAEHSWRNFNIEGSILTQHYDKAPYGAGAATPAITSYPDPADNYIDVTWNFTPAITPVNYELEWTYVDDYTVNMSTFSVGHFSTSALHYKFTNNNTRVWLDSNYYRIPLTYPSGYIVYRVRAVRPDSVLYKYGINGDWSYTLPDSGYISSITTPDYYHISAPYTGDSLNWQYSVNFAEGGKYKHVVNFYDGLLKNRQSITRFNSSSGKLIVSDNVYDLEGRLSIKTLPAPVVATSFSYQPNVDLSALSSLPYSAYDFDTGLHTGCPFNTLIPPLASTARAGIYYSPNNPDTNSFNLFNKYIPNAQGYPMVQTIFEPGYADRIAAQGGAGLRLQIGDSNAIKNNYVGVMQKPVNAIFGANIGWSNFYTMTVSSDQNNQLSMSVKDYHGKLMASSLIGKVDTITHALSNLNVPPAAFYKQNLLLPQTNQVIDTLAGTRTMDADYFNEAQAYDSLQYSCTFNPFQACTGSWLTSKAHYTYYITDHCGNPVLTKTGVIGADSVMSSNIPQGFNGTDTAYYAGMQAYHVHKDFSFYPADITATLDTFFNHTGCFLTENHFIRQSVDSAVFPCSGLADTDACSKMKLQMMQQLFPGGIYAQYTALGDSVIGAANSIFSMVCPETVYHVPMDSTHTVHSRCYDAMSGNWNDTGNVGLVRLDSVWTGSSWSITRDTFAHVPTNLHGKVMANVCYNTDADTTLQIKISMFLPDSVWNPSYYHDSLYTTPEYVFGPIVSPYMHGYLRMSAITTTYPGSFWRITGGADYITSGLGGYGITYLPAYSSLPGYAEADIFVNVHLVGNAINDTFYSTFSGGGGIGFNMNVHIDSLSPYVYFDTTYTISYTGDTLAPITSSPACHYRYRDTCTVALPDTITVAGVLYHGLRTMPADSFIMVYKGAIAAGNYAIAQALLPLHPQYCEMKNCFDDTFKTQVLAIPNWQTASGLALLYLDNLVAADPIKSLMISSGLFPNPTDTLMTFPGGLTRLDTFILMNAYCGCGDSTLYATCVSDMFSYQITHHLLINSTVLSYYYNNIMPAYFGNRQRIVNKIFMNGGDACSHCALARMNLDPAGVVPPAPNAGDTTTTGTDTNFYGNGNATWAYNTTAWYTYGDLQDSAASFCHKTDSTLAAGSIASIVANLANCIAGNPVIRTKISDTLYNIYHSGSAPGGNFSYQQIRYAIAQSGAAINDLCNPYIIDCSNSGAQQPVPIACMPSAFYTAMNVFFNNPSTLLAFHDTATLIAMFLDTTNLFEKKVYSLVSCMEIAMTAHFNPATNIYTLHIESAASTGTFFKLYVHTPCGAVFSSTSAPFTITASCNNSTTIGAIADGLLNRFTFAATVSATGIPTCFTTGCVDTIATKIDYLTNTLSPCVPCTQMRTLYNNFADTLLAYGIAGSDHPLFQAMLADFMNQQLQQSFTATDYLAFITSCALADSARFPLYTGYATYSFINTVDKQNFINALDAVNSNYSFDNSYMDSTLTGDTITVCVNLNIIPDSDLYFYKNFLSAFSGAYLHRFVNVPLAATKVPGEIGFLYTPATILFNPRDSGIIDTTNIRFVGPYSKAVMTGGQFAIQNFYDVVALPGAHSYEISNAVYKLPAYCNNNGVPAVFVPFYQSTIDGDYYKPQKQQWLNYNYRFQGAQPQDALDSLQPRYLSITADSVRYFQSSYQDGTLANLYLWNNGMTGRLFDTLTRMLSVAGTGGRIFHTVRDTVTYNSSPMQLTAYTCADGTYWYRYFTNGDTLFNVYITFPAYISKWQQHYYSYVPSSVRPAPTDSNNACFTLNLQNGSATIQAYGRATFTISKSVELDNVLLGTMSPGVNTQSADTINNCERQTLTSAIYNGIVNYNNYLDSVKNAITAAYSSYLATSVNEQLNLGYMNNEFNYTLYNYDRAGNLAFTVPPAGNNPLAPSLLDSVDATRLDGHTFPGINYKKINNYNYNSYNEVSGQVTIDGGTTRFFYDAAGRLIFSQNAKQQPGGYYTYNIYDKQNRLIETGQVQLGCPYFQPFTQSVFTYGSMPACYYSYFDGTRSFHIGGATITYTIWLVTPDPYFVNDLPNVPYDSVVWYIHTRSRTDVVATIYDTAAKNLGVMTGLDVQQNLRHRVSCVKYFNYLSTFDHAYANYSYATHYSYDIDGNIQTLTQDFPALEYIKQRYKRIDYDYDLISGKVNMLSYNRGLPDQFYQKYAYDADNRITSVQTSNEGLIWNKDATYAYYEHGPLARMTLGSLQVQGVDYAYTIQGWLKAVNGDTLKPALDMGMDGANESVTAKDALAYTIDYFNGDYAPVTNRTVQHTAAPSRNLYNGNIIRQTEAINTFQRLNKQYIYDQLNRIHTANYDTINAATYALTGIADYKNNYRYDADGNILSMVRYGNNTGTGAHLMDSLLYTYTATGADDKLHRLNDYSTDTTFNTIKHFTDTTRRYAYDAIGNTVKDLVSGQDTIQWNLYNKVTATRNNAANNSMMFAYDGAGNRVAKYFTQATDTCTWLNNDYYVREARGNIVAIYHEKDKQVAGMPYITHAAFATAGAAFRAAAGTNTFIQNFLAPEYAGNRDFESAVIANSLLIQPFTNAQTGRPVSFFMNADPAVYNDMLFSNPQYIPALIAGEQAGADTIIAPAYTGMAGAAPQSAAWFLASLLADSAAQARLLALLCNVTNGDSVLTSLVADFNDTDTVSGWSCDTMGLVLAADSPDCYQLAADIITTAQRYGTALSDYMQLIATDSVLYADSAILPALYYGIEQSVSQYGSKSHVTAFFDSYTPARQLLQQVTQPAQLLNIVYADSPAAYLGAYSSALGASFLDSAVAAIHGLSFQPYVGLAEADLGLSGVGGLTFMETVQQDVSLAEHDIYGSSRVGVKDYYTGQAGFSWSMATGLHDTLPLLGRVPWYSLEYQDVIKEDSMNLYGNASTDPYYAGQILGQKQYELTDHLGDVLLTVSDKRANDSLAGVHTTGSTDTVESWKPIIVTAHDYYPFGQYMPGRYWADTAAHCFTAAITEVVPTIVYVPILPYPAYTGGSLVIAGGATITSTGVAGEAFMSVPSAGDGFTYDITGIEPGVQQSITLSLAQIIGTYVAQVTDDSTGNIIGSLNISNTQGNPADYPVPFLPVSGHVTVSLSSTYALPGSVVVSLFTIPTIVFESHEVVTNVCNSEFYRYGHEGVMKVNEIAGLGNHYEFKYREYDPQGDRFWSVDPLVKNYPWNSPYAFAENRVIDGKDLEGKEWSSSGKVFNYITGQYSIDYSIKINVVNKSTIIDNTITNSLLQTIKPFVEGNLSFGKGTSEDPIRTTNIEFTINKKSDFNLVLDDVGANDLLNGEATLGNTVKNQIKLSVTRGGEPRNAFQLGRTLSHELLHTGGVRHIFDPKNDISDAKQMGPIYENKKNNIMNSGANPVKSQVNGDGTDVTKGQLNKVDQQISKDKKNNND